MSLRTDGRLWPLGLALLLASGMGASLAFYWAAARHPKELIGDGAWNAGAGYNAELAAREAGRRRGWTLELRAARSADGVRVELAPRSSGEPLPHDLDVRLRRERPERSDLDADLALAPDGARWVADVPLPLAGRWLLVARAGGADAWVERTYALELPP
ncbi:MAG TPA: FixH family protein [Myxococcota bacterium]|nr:FixH family protein [Myxococcota bacterium]